MTGNLRTSFDINRLNEEFWRIAWIKHGETFRVLLRKYKWQAPARRCPTSAGFILPLMG